MPLSQRRYSIDEELGKRDDDYKVKRRGGRGGRSSPPSWLFPTRFRRRRALTIIVVFIFAIALLRIAIKWGPPIIHHHSNLPAGISDILPAGPDVASKPVPPPREEDDSPEAARFYYGGPFKFPLLHLTLQGASRWRGFLPDNQNVLFATASLKSLAVIIPLACEMARWRRNTVHVAVMGRNDITIDDLLKVNGVNDQCGVTWHDARTDHASYSTDDRLRVSVTIGLEHMSSFIHPQVVLVDRSIHEDGVFLKALDVGAQALNIPIISLPDGAVESMMWMTRLDSGSLRAWNQAEVSILIRAHQQSSGGLLRLLKSLRSAEYGTSLPPHITIELSAVIDPPTLRFLETFQWPPSRLSTYQQNSNQLILRHRVRRANLIDNDDDDDRSVQFVESFYPKSLSHSHVLILSPQVELSPHFYHYVKFALLEYKYSSYGVASARDDLLGISLCLPARPVNGSVPFEQSSSSTEGRRDSARTGEEEEEKSLASHLLWEAPDANAALYFGDKWAELHDFVRRRVEAQEMLAKPDVRPRRRRRLSNDHPRWMEYLLELTRLRGYYMLYPQLGSENIIATVHNELYHYPEENNDDGGDGAPRNEVDVSVSDSSSYLATTRRPEPSRLTGGHHHQSLLSMLPADGDLPELDDLALLSYAGHQRKSLADNHAVAIRFAAQFRRDIGACGGGGGSGGGDDGGGDRLMDPPNRKLASAADLFCLDDDA